MASLHTHCCRELFHSCWEILLDKDFLFAYRHGIVLKCADGVMRRVFPHIFTYSADYPEKYTYSMIFLKILNHSSIYRALIATIKDMGLCPCPCCLTPKSFFSFLGLARDMNSCINNLRVYVMAKVVKAHDYIYGGEYCRWCKSREYPQRGLVGSCSGGSNYFLTVL